MPAEEKGAIDCLKWREGVNFETHRVIAGLVTQAALKDFIIFKTEIAERDTGNQTGWEAYIENHYNFNQPDDD